MRKRQVSSPAAFGTTQALPCLTTPSRAELCPAMPSRALSVSLYCYPSLAKPYPTWPRFPCPAEPCRVTGYLLSSIFEVVNRPYMPLFCGRQSPTPIWRPAMSNHSSRLSWSISSSSTSTSNVQDQGVSNLARVRKFYCFSQQPERCTASSGQAPQCRCRTSLCHSRRQCSAPPARP